MKHLLFFLITVLLIQAFGPSTAFATPEEGARLVEINYPIDVYAPYKERRRTHGANFGIHLENYVPGRWESLIDSEYYEDTYGKTPIALTSFEGGYKYNFVLGSVSFMGGIGYGEATTTFLGASRVMGVYKYFGRGMYTLDNLLPEPYIVPYVAGSVWQMRIKESETGSSDGGTVTTGIGFDYSFGALFQLNWMDPELAAQTLNENGIQNTYLDIFATQYLKTIKKADSSLASNFILGFGLRLEF